MRSIAADEDKVLTATGGRRVRVRVKVKDSGGTFRDLTTYPGSNFVTSVSWGEDIDSNGMDANIILKRESEQISVAPLMTGSPLNRAFAYPGTYSALIDLAREVQIEVAVVPDGFEPASGDWKLAFHGYVDEINPGQRETMEFKCSGLEAKIRDAWIERERCYAFAQGANATRGCIVWRPADTLAVGERAVPTEANRNLHFYRVTSITTGITGSAEPTWPTGAGATVVDGGVTWTESGATSITAGTLTETVMQQILDDFVGGVTLVTPVSPAWAIRAYKPDRQSVWAALRTLSDQIGWDFRYRWDSGSSSFKLTFSTPDRAKVTPDRTFGPGQRYRLSRLSTNVAWIRNVVQVIYSDSGDLDTQGSPKRKRFAVSDATSITAYGRRFCEIAEEATANIDSLTEATTLATNVVKDLALPTAEHECELPMFRFVELSDLIRWSADGYHYDTDQDLAVVSYHHKVSSGLSPQARTTLVTRGKPSTGVRKWLAMAGYGVHAQDLDNTNQLTITVLDAPGGNRFNIQGDMKKVTPPPEYELHISETQGFTPSTATLHSQGQATTIMITDKTPGKQHYSRVVPIGHNARRIVRGQPSAEIPFIPGRASAGHVKEGIALGDYPLNGGFETRVDTAGMPDHWTLTLGTYNTDVIVKEDGNGISGGRYLRMIGKTSGDVVVVTANIPVTNETANANRYTEMYRLSAWVKNDSGNTVGTLRFTMSFLDYLGASTGSAANLNIDATTKKGAWQLVERYYFVGGSADTRSAKLQVNAVSAASAFTCDIDNVRIQHLGSPWFEVGDTTKFTDDYEAIPAFANSWVNYDATNEQKVAFRRNQYGRVYFKGLAKSGTVGAGTAMFTLPVPWRPVKSLRFSVPNLPETHVRARRATAQTLTTGTATVIQYATENWDTLNEFDVATNVGRFTATYSGYYNVRAQVLFDSVAWAVTQAVRMWIRKNGSGVEFYGTREAIQANFTDYFHHHIAGTVFLAAGDYIEILADHSRGVNTALIADGDWNHVAIDRTGDQHATVEVQSDGKVCVTAGNNARVDLSSISYELFQTNG